MRVFRLVIALTLLSAAAVPQAAAAACMLMRADMAMEHSSSHQHAVTTTDTPDDCPVTRCVAPTIAQIAGLPTSVEFADPDRASEPQRILDPISWAISPALPPPKQLLSSS